MTEEKDTARLIADLEKQLEGVSAFLFSAQKHGFLPQEEQIEEKDSDDS